MKLTKLAMATLALAAAPALANDQVIEGATVYGPQGGKVGTIVTIADGQAIVDTGKHQVPLAIAMYGEGESGPTITVTQAQLNSIIDTQIAEANAARDAALVEGATVQTADNQALGTIKEVDGDNVVIARGGDETQLVTLLREYFSATDTGLVARLTLAQIDAASGGSAE